ncbi:hypothetical protein EAL2_808p00180 (plasmid) [Peptoclostridium acidaminophilum DSM 3953]|uniref:Uncharacterized protein n=1 Tax=Peptoclostridium acidaminophilum DSM 3953 TaxID=1286171 RepID=W8T9C7_PEPAC|nr:hypothetical protein EAL2_808p00180 [Peptoclostridium acidaminophilum DSM 3953]
MVAKACFNSRTRTGCDTAIVAALGILIGFNSRTRTGCDLMPFAFARSVR